MEGLIVKNISDLFYIVSDNSTYICKAKGVFKKKNIIPMVGDKVIFDEKKLIITNILNRKNKLIRPPICNIDQAIVVMSVVNPLFSANLIDKFINIIEFNNIKPIICLTKLDLINNESDINKYIDYYKNIGYEVIINTEINKIKSIISNKITVITGQSGVGKSSLLNKLE